MKIYDADWGGWVPVYLSEICREPEQGDWFRYGVELPGDCVFVVLRNS